MENQITYLLEHYGYFGIIFALIGGIVGLPIPDEVLLTYIGYNVFQGELSYLISIVSAFVGATVGISLSYFIGYKFGLPLLEKFGPKIHITEQKINRTKNLFKKFGPYLLLFGYFIPGVRHLTAYMAAVNRFSFRKFIIYAYAGALIWSFTFITLGRILGENWTNVELYISTYRIYLITSILVLTIFFYLLWKRRNRLRRGIS
ncbi:putative membrane protein Rv2637 [Peribacillus sp. Bi96]|uniref:DedA family protein n=1 Tax=Peribacillus sp. Bi96 TaxID=2884273 RepID=UPI001DBBD484|nr:DedA family protein [Peribacillus sp. Bi96]CAH0156653.1 putative membrane protein Rv2637 [Peribacillus sp. Bi96]